MRRSNEIHRHGAEMASEVQIKALREAFAKARDLDGPLEQRLTNYSNAIREFHPAYAQAVDDLVERLNENKAGESTPRPGETMPSFTLPDEAGRLVSLEELTDAGPGAGVFHRGAWWPGWPLSHDAL